MSAEDHICPCQVLQWWSGCTDRGSSSPAWSPCPGRAHLGQAGASINLSVSITHSPSKASAPLWGQGHGLRGSPLTSQSTQAVFRVCTVTINEENCKLEHSVWAGHWAQNLGWVLKPRRNQEILPAAPSVHVSQSIFIFVCKSLPSHLHMPDHRVTVWGENHHSGAASPAPASLSC